MVAGHKTGTVRRKCDAKREPLHRKCFWTRVAGHKTLTVQQKCRAPGQPPRIPKASMWYESDTRTGQGWAEEDDFEVIRGAAIEVDMALG